MEKGIMSALLSAQQEMKPAVRESRNNFKGYNYADINSVLEVVRPILNRHGLVVTQAVSSSGHPEFHPVITTAIGHPETGQSFESAFTIPCDARDMQKVGAAITYGRRYALVSMLALEQEDPDCDQQIMSAPSKPQAPCNIYRKAELEDKKRLAAMMRDAGIPASEMKQFSDKVSSGWTWEKIAEELKK